MPKSSSALSGIESLSTTVGIESLCGASHATPTSARGKCTLAPWLRCGRLRGPPTSASTTRITYGWVEVTSTNFGRSFTSVHSMFESPA
jgi:hypothetical protein